MGNKTVQAAEILYQEYLQKIPYSLMNTELAPVLELSPIIVLCF